MAVEKGAWFVNNLCTEWLRCFMISTLIEKLLHEKMNKIDPFSMHYLPYAPTMIASVYTSLICRYLFCRLDHYIRLSSLIPGILALF